MTIKQILEQMLESKFTNMNVRICKVLEVYTDKTALVEPVDGKAEFLVRLQANSVNGLYIKPKIDSLVGISMINDHVGAVVVYGEIDSITLLDGTYNGIVKADELKEQLDKTNEVLQAVVDSLANWVVVANDGGAALKTAFATALGTKTVGDYSDIKNDKITHGQ
jgi:hypothetical protein